MTEADREALLNKYAELSMELRSVMISEFETRNNPASRYEQEHLLRVSFFADILEDME